MGSTRRSHDSEPQWCCFAFAAAVLEFWFQPRVPGAGVLVQSRRERGKKSEPRRVDAPRRTDVRLVELFVI